MKIFMFAPQSIPLPAKNYGGTQRVICALARAMTGAGHRVWVGAPKGSRPAPNLRTLTPAFDVVESEFGPRDDRADYMGDIAGRIPDADIIHIHAGWQHAAVAKRGIPILCTLHGNDEGLPPCPTSFVSRSHRASYGQAGAPWIYDTVMLEETEYCAKPDNYFLWLGGLQCGDRKGVFVAVDAARKAGVELLIAGTRGGVIMDRLAAVCDKKRRYIGPIGGKRKRKLLSRARGLIFPALWSEPCGVTMLEALMCGVPVIGSGEGSQAEILDPIIGFKCGRDADSYALAIRNVGMVDRAACARRAREYFHPEVIARQYVQLYRRVIAGEVRPPIGRGDPVGRPATQETPDGERRDRVPAPHRPVRARD